MKRTLSKKNGMLKLIVLMMVLAMTMMSFAACGSGGDESAEQAETAGTITVTDHADRQVEVPADIQRIAVCDIYPLPSALAVFFDSADKIVGMPMPSMTASQNGLLGQLYYTEFVNLPLLFCLISDLLYHLGAYVFAFLLSGHRGFGAYLTRIALPELLYTGLMTLLLYPLLKKAEAMIERWEIKKTHNYV